MLPIKAKIYIGVIQFISMNSPKTIQFNRKCRIGPYEYDPRCLIGVGFYGKVFKGQEVKTQTPVAIKVIDLNNHPDPEVRVFCQNQKQIHTSLNHPHVLRCLDVITKGNTFYFVTEYQKEGDLEKFLKQKGCLTEEEALRLFQQVVQGLVYLKRQYVIHRDIKPANIFLCSNGVKIADFGLSVRAYRDLVYDQLRIGTPKYMAPEALREGIYSFKCDIWSLGSLFIQMITGEAPLAKCQSFEDVSEKVLFNMIPLGLKLSGRAHCMLQSLFEKDVSRRISIEELYESPIFERSFKIMSSISTTKGSESYEGDETSSVSFRESETMTMTDSILTVDREFRDSISVDMSHRTVNIFAQFTQSVGRFHHNYEFLNSVLQSLRAQKAIKTGDSSLVVAQLNRRIGVLEREQDYRCQMEAINLSYFRNVLEDQTSRVTF